MAAPFVRREIPERTMKIVLTMNLPYFPTYGGANKGNRSLLEGFARKGHEVSAVVPALGVPSPFTREQVLEKLAAEGVALKSEDGADVYTLNGVEVRAVAEPSQLRARLAEHLRRSRPDRVIVSTEDASQSLLDAALKALPERVVYLVHSMSFLPFGPHAFFPGPSRVRLLGRAAAIVCVSRYVADYVRRWGGLDSTAIHLPSYGDGPFPRFGDFDRGYVTMVNPCAVKGISIFLALAESMPDVSFAAVPTWGTTNADREALGRLPNVTLLKAADDIDDIFKQTRVLLVPSVWGEGFPMIIVEALLRGVPVVASDAGGNPETKLGTDFVIPVRPVERFGEELDENVVPIPVIPPQDVGPWREALGRLLGDRALYERQSHASREAALEFVSGLGVEPFEELLSSLVAVAEVGARPETAADETHAPAAAREPAAPPNGASLTPEQRALLLLRLRRRASREDSDKRAE
jgi:glycosyltransferase involved in cell wall biosynthesis